MSGTISFPCSDRTTDPKRPCWLDNTAPAACAQVDNRDTFALLSRPLPRTTYSRSSSNAIIPPIAPPDVPPCASHWTDPGTCPTAPLASQPFLARRLTSLLAPASGVSEPPHPASSKGFLPPACGALTLFITARLVPTLTSLPPRFTGGPRLTSAPPLPFLVAPFSALPRVQRHAIYVRGRKLHLTNCLALRSLCGFRCPLPL